MTASAPVRDDGHKQNRDVAVYFLAKLAPAVLGFITVFFLTRALAPEGYGDYALVMTVALVSTQCLAGWITQAMFFYLPRELEFGDLTSSFGKMTFLAAVSGTAAISFGLILSRMRPQIAIAGAGVFAVQVYWNYFSTYYQSRERSLVQLVATLCQVGLQAVVLTALYYTKTLTSLSALLTVFVGFFAGALILYASGRNDGVDVSGVIRVDRQRLWHHIRLTFQYGAPVSVWFVAVQMYTFSDRFLLKWAGLTSELGRYSAVRDLLLGLVSMIAMPLLVAAHPTIMRMWSERRPHADIAEVIQRNLTIISAVGALMGIVLYDYGAVIFSVVLSHSYDLRNIQYVLIGATIIVSVASMYAHKGLEVTGATHKMAMLALGVAALSTVLNLATVRHYGLSGVIVVGLISQSLYFGLASWLSRRVWVTPVPGRRIAVILLITLVIHSAGKWVDLIFASPVGARVTIPPGLLVEAALAAFCLLSMREVRGIVRALTYSGALASTP